MNISSKNFHCPKVQETQMALECDNVIQVIGLASREHEQKIWNFQTPGLGSLYLNPVSLIPQYWGTCLRARNERGGLVHWNNSSFCSVWSGVQGIWRNVNSIYGEISFFCLSFLSWVFKWTSVNSVFRGHPWDELNAEKLFHSLRNGAGCRRVNRSLPSRERKAEF